MTQDLYAFRPIRVFLVFIALLFAYGAVVHGFNMAGASGFVWADAPLKWQALDVVYLLLDVAVAAGLLWRRNWGVVLWIAAAYSQIVLYTLFRSWVLDVPQAFARPGGEQALDGLLAFHFASLLIFGLLVWWRQKSGG